MEIWDAYDANLNKLENKTLVRGEIIPDDIFHLVCDILVRHTDGTYLVMQRDLRKSFGGTWEATAGGSALCGETPVECAKRELKEETGITATDITQVGCVVDKGTHSIYVEFLCITNCDKNAVELQEGETIAYKWVSRNELLNMNKDKLITERMQQFISELH